MGLFSIIGYIAGILGLVAIAGGAVAYFGKSRGESIIAYQAKELELRDGTIARLEKSEAALIAERDSLKEQVTTLTGLAQGSPQLIELTKQIKELAGSIGKHFTKQERGQL